ncbi:DUF2750 domain-containing protein [Pseudoalteromonas sp. T1lg48]|uniref:DUF2750 domain-containing protein n=1 Tax=Pseudoalteromonas sp. T1lg48 TaxID=2077100 RepID=UPI000CF6CF90|nr:DUF2750 domain-containing protein [Pseudoalteromonas sp. T1lg48]
MAHDDIEIESQWELFCEQVQQTQEVWLLGSDDGGIASVSSAYDDNQDVLLMWHSEELAQAQCTGDWQGFTPFSLSLDEVLEDFAPQLIDDNVMVGINWDNQVCTELSAKSLVSALTD